MVDKEVALVATAGVALVMIAGVASVTTVEAASGDVTADVGQEEGSAVATTTCSPADNGAERLGRG